MSEQLIPLILVVENHWLAGKIRVVDQRVLDLLNDKQTDFIDLENVKVFSSFDRKRCLANVATMVIPKDRLFLAIIPTDRHEIPRKQRMHKIVEKRQLDVVTVDAGYFVQGKLHLSTHVHDPRYILANALGHFFPITSATVSGPSDEPVTASTVLANKVYVSSIGCARGESEPMAAAAAATGGDSGRSVGSHLLIDRF